MDIKKNNSGLLPEGADPLIDGVVKARAFVSRNGTTIAICCAALIIIVGGTFVYSNMRESSIRKAQEIFGVGILDYNADQVDKALESFGVVANNYRHTPIGTMSAFMMGSIYLEQDNIEQAITWFEAAISGGESGFAKGQANEGLSAAYEKRGDMGLAIGHLEKALRDKNAMHRHAAIRWKLALLNKDNAAVASVYCKELLADTLATSYHQKAENLLAAVNAAQ